MHFLGGLPFLIAHFSIHGFDQLWALQQMVVNQEPEKGEKTKQTVAISDYTEESSVNMSLSLPPTS